MSVSIKDQVATLASKVAELENSNNALLQRVKQSESEITSLREFATDAAVRLSYNVSRVFPAPPWPTPRFPSPVWGAGPFPRSADWNPGFGPSLESKISRNLLSSDAKRLDLYRLLLRETKMTQLYSRFVSVLLRVKMDYKGDLGTKLTRLLYKIAKERFAETYESALLGFTHAEDECILNFLNDEGMSTEELSNIAKEINILARGGICNSTVDELTYRQLMTIAEAFSKLL